jgi:hypothetical protein
MKIIKTANGKKKIKMSFNEWQLIGKTAGWMKSAYELGDLGEDESEYVDALAQFHKENNRQKLSLIRMKKDWFLVWFRSPCIL